jgi:hypothetical protein
MIAYGVSPMNLVLIRKSNTIAENRESPVNALASLLLFRDAESSADDRRDSNTEEVMRCTANPKPPQPYSSPKMSLTHAGSKTTGLSKGSALSAMTGSSAPFIGRRVVCGIARSTNRTY